MTPQPVPELRGVVSDQTARQLRERNEMRFHNARVRLGERYVCYKPVPKPTKEVK